MNEEQQYLWIHVAEDGLVWIAGGLKAPTATQYGVDEFVKVLPGNPLLRTRLLGTTANARMIAALHERQRARQLYSIELASPRICENKLELGQPVRAIYRMRQTRLHASLGGWHRATACDVATYELCLQQQRTPGDQQGMEALVRRHPVWRDLSFIRGIDPYFTGLLLSRLRDPRWFVDPMHPDRVSRAFGYLGLWPAMQQRIVTQEATTPASRRCQLVLRAWKEPMAPEDVAVKREPGYFLWRRRASQADPVRGDLRASQAFIIFLLRTWSQRLAIAANNPVDLFHAESLLTGAEAEAYRKHVALYDD